MNQSHIHTRYAKSLLLLAQEKNLLDEIKSDIELIYKTLINSEDLKKLLDHPILKSSRKSEILGQIFNQNINKLTHQFLKLIVKNKRENSLKFICLKFINLYKESKRIKTAVLTTAYKLNDKEKTNIISAIEKKFNVTVELHEKVNENLIGGMIIQIEDQQLDLSVAKQIQRLKSNLLEIDFNNKLFKI